MSDAQEPVPEETVKIQAIVFGEGHIKMGCAIFSPTEPGVILQYCSDAKPVGPSDEAFVPDGSEIALVFKSLKSIDCFEKCLQSVREVLAQHLLTGEPCKTPASATSTETEATTSNPSQSPSQVG